MVCRDMSLSSLGCIIFSCPAVTLGFFNTSFLENVSGASHVFLRRPETCFLGGIMQSGTDLAAALICLKCLVCHAISPKRYVLLNQGENVGFFHIWQLLGRHDRKREEKL